MILYLIRHGVAVDRGTDSIPDAERPLTSEGIQRMRQNARGLRRLGVKIDAVWTSPLVRARQTAELLAGEYAIANTIKQEPALSPGSDVSRILDPLRGAPKNAQIALVGHEPHLGQLATYLLTGLNSGAMEFKKGGVACIRMETLRRRARGQLLWLLTPRQLRRIRKSV